MNRDCYLCSFEEFQAVIWIYSHIWTTENKEILWLHLWKYRVHLVFSTNILMKTTDFNMKHDFNICSAQPALTNHGNIKIYSLCFQKLISCHGGPEIFFRNLWKWASTVIENVFKWYLRMSNIRKQWEDIVESLQQTTGLSWYEFNGEAGWAVTNQTCNACLHLVLMPWTSVQIGPRITQSPANA